MEVGSIVKLKVGGPKMVISSLLEDNRVICTWYDDSRLDFEEYIFDKNTLKEVSKCDDLLLEENRRRCEEALPDEM
jgi:uncharacterized protein YodC (DUF2158 family)